MNQNSSVKELEKIRSDLRQTIFDFSWLRIPIIVILVSFLATIGLYLLYINSSPKMTNLITITGQITCLPKKGQGPQTLECALGLKNSQGLYYALKNLDKFDPEYKFSSNDTYIEVSGQLRPEEMTSPNWNKYAISGVIEINSIKETFVD